ncbi:hypothetical protein GCM10018955_04000 [Planomonospora venezuelensis]
MRNSAARRVLTGSGSVVVPVVERVARAGMDVTFLRVTGDIPRMGGGDVRFHSITYRARVKPPVGERESGPLP